MTTYKELVNKYNVPVPRYTSYPPANHFNENISSEDFIRIVKKSNQLEPENIAFYIHIPFCTRICFYCGCNACSAKNDTQIDEYINVLKLEIKRVTSLIDKNRKISQIHFGGGTPNSIDVKYLEEIVVLLSKDFEFIDSPEIAIECNPAWLDFPYLDRLIKAKFNRFSFGIQDFDPVVLKDVNREPSLIPLDKLLSYIKSKSPQASVNLDFIYGLPGQSVESFSKTIQQAASLRPERLVTFSYAHVPWLKKHQQILEKKGLPDSDLKTKMFFVARNIMIDEGYQPIGLDHYVLPTDDLFIALNSNELHRNFQGYCTRKTTGQVYAFGVSAISQLQNAYIQNTKDQQQYINLVKQDRFPALNGCELSKEEMIIREAITELMCNQVLNFENIALNFNVSTEKFKSITRIDESTLLDFQSDGLINMVGNNLIVTKKGMLFIRNIAAAFDPSYEPQKNKYSKSI